MSKLLLRVPQPCAESWEAMTPAGPGRHCAACRKVVVDFSQKTDAELLAYFRQATGQPTCGRLRPDQLNRTLHPAAPMSRWRAWLASALALGGVLGAGRATAQSRSNYAGPLPEIISPSVTEVVPAPVVARVHATAAAASPVAAASAVAAVSGLVLDAENGQPLPGATVLVRGTNLGTSTDSAGRFQLDVPAAADSLQLSVMFIGYVRQELVARGSQPLTVRLRPDEQTLGGEVVIVGGISSRRPWHPRTLYRWTRFRVGQLFGR